MAYSIFIDTKQTEKMLRKLAKNQVPFAVAKGLTITAAGARDMMKQDIPNIFDNNNAFTRNAVGISPANKLDLIARVFVKDQQAEYLGFEEFGGSRSPGEGAKNSNAKAIPLGGKDARKKAGGTLPRNYIKNLAARAKADKARPKGTKGKKLRFSIVKISGKAPNGMGAGGFFKRDRKYGTIKRLVEFFDEATYKPKFGFLNKVSDNIQQELSKNIEEAFNDVLRDLNK
ncbi:hypothetical protein [Entomobacter blattae]|uniref:Uncharacterized protein n=1 Tax=Entomobacter blattae TaxID=2762277 RepID=A0A7H1NUH0_9PROT|nr:hypothetical protein [Entomobacter blattae]QNT79430.1 hypothetical protein JGUZn3_22290 [Entomobacter blattae]